jgi:hypothetical protein
MTYPQAILAGAALIALAIVAVEASRPSAQTGGTPLGTYQISADSRSGGVWQTNTQTGEIRLCQAPSEIDQPPRCLNVGAPWQ